jgi:hypothetical protein
MKRILACQLAGFFVENLRNANDLKILLAIILAAGMQAVSSQASDYIPTGSSVIISDPTNTVCFGADTIASLDLFMTDIADKNTDALKGLLSEGRLIPIKNGSKATTIGFNRNENAYKVRVFGSNKAVWVTKDLVSQS